MNSGSENALNLVGDQGKDTGQFPLAETNPKYFTFLTGLLKGNIHPTFTATGWANVAKRFDLTVEEAQLLADDFIMKGGQSW